MPRTRRPLVVVVLTLMTFGIYGLYWFYLTSRDILSATGRDSSPVLWLIGLFIPLVNLVVMWRYSEAAVSATGKGGALTTFLLLVFLYPAAQYLVQKRLNQAAGDASSPLPP